MEHFARKDGRLHAEDVDLETLAAEIGTPFYCYSTATLERHYRVFAEALAPLSPLICFATKANPNPAVIATLARLGAGADVVSEGEIRLALAGGVAPEKIIFSGVGKTAAEMAFALDADIHQFNVESLPELELLSTVAEGMGKRAPVALRVNPDVDPKTHAKISTGQKESKFGIPLAEARSLYTRARDLPGIRIQGISVHIGSQLTTLDPFREAFTRLRAFVEDLRTDGHPIDIVDLGGGLGIPYKPDEHAPPLPQLYGEMVAEVMHGLDARFAFEPGRLLVGNAGILVSRVVYVKESAGRTFVVTDAAMNDLMRPALYDAHHDIVPVFDASRPAAQADIVGPVCETGDIFATRRELPELRAGDLIAFRSAGAYGASMSNTYNARPLVAEVLVKGDEHAVIRPRQTYEDMLGRYRPAGWLA